VTRGAGTKQFEGCPSVLEIPAFIFDRIIEHARGELPLECCGLLAGQGSAISVHYVLRNELASPVAYSADARDLFLAFRDMRDRALELLAIYHSHPNAPAYPSQIDLRENYYGDTPRIIISLAREPPEVRAFRLLDDHSEEIPCVRKAG
jgi:proteasome lid subunit RPN8/RPN11